MGAGHRVCVCLSLLFVDDWAEPPLGKSWKLCINYLDTDRTTTTTRGIQIKDLPSTLTLGAEKIRPLGGVPLSAKEAHRGQHHR